MDGWRTSLSFRDAIFSGAMLGSGRVSGVIPLDLCRLTPDDYGLIQRYSCSKQSLKLEFLIEALNPRDPITFSEW